MVSFSYYKRFKCTPHDFRVRNTKFLSCLSNDQTMPLINAGANNSRLLSAPYSTSCYKIRRVNLRFHVTIVTCVTIAAKLDVASDILCMFLAASQSPLKRPSALTIVIFATRRCSMIMTEPMMDILVRDSIFSNCHTRVNFSAITCATDVLRRRASLAIFL